MTDIWQAAYTAGAVLPKPVATTQYWHRSLNPKKLISVGFSRLQVMLLKGTLLCCLACSSHYVFYMPVGDPITRASIPRCITTAICAELPVRSKQSCVCLMLQAFMVILLTRPKPLTFGSSRCCPVMYPDLCCLTCCYKLNGVWGMGISTQ